VLVRAWSVLARHLKSSTLLLTTVLILSIAGLLFLAPRARRSLGAHRIPLETGLLIPSGPTPIDPREADVDNQVAAPAETGTPNLHRAIIAHKECGWKDGVRGDWAERQRLPLGKTQIILTVTGLLMEGVDFIELEGNGVIRAINTVSVTHSRLTCRNL